jgi:hypothetical protein
MERARGLIPRLMLAFLDRSFIAYIIIRNNWIGLGRVWIATGGIERALLE